MGGRDKPDHDNDCRWMAATTPSMTAIYPSVSRETRSLQYRSL